MEPGGLVPTSLIVFKETFRWSIFFYETVGVQSIFQTAASSLPIKTFFWTSFWNLALSYIAEWIYLFTSFGNREGFMQITASVPCMCVVTMALNAMLVMLQKRHRIRAVLATLEENYPKTVEEQESQGVPKRVKAFNRLLNSFCVAFLILIMTFNFFEFAMTIVDYYRIGTWRKELPYFLWYPFDPYDDRWFTFLYLLQTWAGFTTVFAIIAEICLMGVVVLQMDIQFEVISNSVRQFKPQNPKESEEFVRRIVIQHETVLQRAKDFSDLMERTMFIHHMCSSLVICFTGFQIVFGDNFIAIWKYLQFFVCSVVLSLTVSYFGNRLRERSLKVGDAVYDSNWTEGDAKYRRGLLMIMMRSSKPMSFTGYGYFTVSLAGFTKVLSTSYSYFALIRTMYSSD